MINCAINKFIIKDFLMFFKNNKMWEINSQGIYTDETRIREYIWAVANKEGELNEYQTKAS